MLDIKPWIVLDGIRYVYNIIFCFLVDFVAAPFRRDLLHIYENCDDPDVFFRPGLRVFLVGILKNLIDFDYSRVG